MSNTMMMMSSSVVSEITMVWLPADGLAVEPAVSQDSEPDIATLSRTAQPWRR